MNEYENEILEAFFNMKGDGMKKARFYHVHEARGNTCFSTQLLLTPDIALYEHAGFTMLTSIDPFTYLTASSSSFLGRNRQGP